MIPEFLTRYYVAGENPFTSLNDLALAEANVIKMRASDKYDWGGFYAQDDYLVHRREIEQWIRSQMREKGGKPVDDVPVYMFLGDVNGQFDKFGADTVSLQIPLADLDLSAVSFAWPDSMYEMVVDENGNFTGEGTRTNTPRVYMHDELSIAVDCVARFQAACGKDAFSGVPVEAQVWDRSMLQRWYGERSFASLRMTGERIV